MIHALQTCYCTNALVSLLAPWPALLRAAQLLHLQTSSAEHSVHVILLHAPQPVLHMRLQVAASALKGPAGALTSLLEDCTDTALELDRLLKDALFKQLCTPHEGLKGLAHAVLHGQLPFNLSQLLREEGGTLPSQLPVSIAAVCTQGTCLP